tara:strand:- start:291 stop:626 length:336 start_codon:yes stop_codon:yes gene_type:complete
MNRETLRNKLNEVEQTVKWKRPDDTMRFRYGLPKDDVVVYARSVKQLTLDEWFDLDNQTPSKKVTLDNWFDLDNQTTSNNIWDFDITIHTSVLIKNTTDEVVNLILKELPA